MKLLIGIPTCREDKNFWDSMAKFLPDANILFELEVIEVRNKPIADARNIIVDYFLSKDFEYLLFLDDDHSGHHMGMLYALLKNNYPICAMKCYARFFPHLCTLMNLSGLGTDKGKYQTKRNTEGYDECDLVGFGMTLIKRELFDKLDKPYFKSINNQKEDNYFCDSLIAKGIRPVGCFDYVCTHDGVDDSNVIHLRNTGLSSIMDDLMSKENFTYNNEKLMVVG